MLTKKRIRAFTLVELTVTIAVTSIMLVFLGTFLGFFSSQYQLNQYNDRNFNSAYLLENAIINIIDRNNYNFIEVKEKKKLKVLLKYFLLKITMKQQLIISLKILNYYQVTAMKVVLLKV